MKYLPSFKTACKRPVFTRVGNRHVGDAEVVRIQKSTTMLCHRILKDRGRLLGKDRWVRMREDSYVYRSLTAGLSAEDCQSVDSDAAGGL